ncbi:hypothetical protein SH139x_002965 [Planctomycetaceae bacterium SH139]
MLLVSAPALVLLTVAVGDQRLAFRDVAHFYSPLQTCLQRFSTESLFPIWSPLDRFGVSLAGETTTALFYPGRLLFLLGLPIENAIGCYVLVHLWIAGAGSYRLARYADAARGPALFAAVIYPYSGCVFYLYTNPPFLVGASWLPWSLLSLLQLCNARITFRKLALATLPLSMSVLGGDPQTAVHVILIACLFAFVARPPEATIWHRLVRVMPRLMLVSLCTSAAAAPQIAASYDWAGQSWRQQTQPPTLPAALLSAGIQPAAANPRDGTDAIGAGLFRRPDRATHAADIYDFSVPPWYLPQLISPYVSGLFAERNERWQDGFSAAERNWTPTLYAGLFALLAALATIGATRRIDHWLLIVVVALLLAAGRFGLVYLLRTVSYWCGGPAEWAWGDAVGGAYWWLVALIPGYGQFRYPAKWLPFVALGLAMHASRFLTWQDAKSIMMLRRLAMIVAWSSLLVAFFSWLPMIREMMIELAEGPRTHDPFWGPLNVDSALRAIRLSCLQTWLVGVAIQALIGRQQGWIWLLVLTVIELSCVASWQLHTTANVPSPLRPITANAAGQDDVPSQDEMSSEDDVPADFRKTPSFPPRYLLFTDEQAWPRRWAEQPAGPNRLAAVDAGQAETWFVRWHLAAGVHVLNNHVSVDTAVAKVFWDALAAKERRLNEASFRAGKALTVAELRARVGNFLAAGAIVTRTSHREVANQQPTLNHQPLPERQPIIRWSKNYRVAAPPMNRQQLAERVDALLAEISEQGRGRVPIVDSQLINSTVPAGDVTRDEVTGGEQQVTTAGLRLVSYAASKFRLRATTPAAGLLTVMQYQDGNWRATVRDLTGNAQGTSVGDEVAATVHQVDLIAQGIILPAGSYEIYFQYQPAWWWPSWLLALFTWSGLLWSLRPVVQSPKRSSKQS